MESRNGEIDEEKQYNSLGLGDKSTFIIDMGDGYQVTLDGSLSFIDDEEEDPTEDIVATEDNPVAFITTVGMTLFGFLCGVLFALTLIGD